MVSGIYVTSTGKVTSKSKIYPNIFKIPVVIQKIKIKIKIKIRNSKMEKWLKKL